MIYDKLIGSVTGHAFDLILAYQLCEDTAIIVPLLRVSALIVLFNSITFDKMCYLSFLNSPFLNEI